MRKILKKNWINRLIEGETKKAEVVVSLSVQEVMEKLCLWGKCDGATTDVCSISLENEQEVITAVLSKYDVTLLIVVEQSEEGAKVYLSASMKEGNIRNKVEEYLDQAIDVLLHYIVKIEKISSSTSIKITSNKTKMDMISVDFFLTGIKVVSKFSVVFSVTFIKSLFAFSFVCVKICVFSFFSKRLFLLLIFILPKINNLIYYIIF